MLPDATRWVEAGYIEWQSDCAFCNAHKGTNLSGIDPKTGAVARLFDPRRQRWRRHFRRVGARVVGRTASGRATVSLLRMNTRDRVELRKAILADEAV